MSLTLVHHHRILSIVGDILKVRVGNPGGEDASGVKLGDLAVVRDSSNTHSLAQTVRIDGGEVSLQLFSGSKGISNRASVRFLGHPMRVTYSANILGRVFSAAGSPLDGGSDLALEPKIAIGGPSMNPMRRVLASRMIRTDVPMIDVFNCLVESQKIPIFSVSGEPYNPFLARIGIQADADIVVFGGMGLIFDDFHFFQTTFEDAGVFARTIMFPD